MPDDHIVDDVLRRSAEMEIPAGVEARMRQQFTEFRGRLDRRRRPLRDLSPSLPVQRLFRWAAAGAVLATVLAIVFLAGGTNGGRVYAAAVSRLAAARSVQYTMDLAPFVSVEFSHMAPAHDRIATSWGIEVRRDGSGMELVLLHGSRQYAREQKSSGSVPRTADLIEQLTSLPRTADSMLGERMVGGRRLAGYRVMGARMPGQHGLEWLDLWLDLDSGALVHADITPAGASASAYQMHIRDVRVDVDVDPALFDMKPPAGYSALGSARTAEGPSPRSRIDVASLQPRITQAAEQPALVVPMSGSYAQASGAAARVWQHLQQRGVVPAGPAFGRFESEAHWEVGYPVPPGTSAQSPFEVITLPAGLVASVVVDGPWGEDSPARWSWLFAWLGEHGFVPVGPPSEVWSGDEAQPDAQVTEMRIAVAAARR